MKKIFMLSISILLLVSSLISAAEPSKIITQKFSDNTIKSLLVGLESTNLGLKTSSAYMIGELKIANAVIPLMRMLRNNESEEARIVAALALYKLGTPTSIFAIKQASRFDDSERVRKMCFRFYAAYVQENAIEKI